MDKVIPFHPVEGAWAPGAASSPSASIGYSESSKPPTSNALQNSLASSGLGPTPASVEGSERCKVSCAQSHDADLLRDAHPGKLQPAEIRHGGAPETVRMDAGTLGAHCRAATTERVVPIHRTSAPSE